MAFRSTNVSVGDAFATAAAPGQALAGSIDKIGLGLANVVTKFKEAEEKRKKEQDAIGLFQAARSGDINNLFGRITDDDNADLALNLAKVLMTKQQHEAELSLRASLKKEKDAKDQAERDFVKEAGFDLLGAVRETLTIAPEVKVTEMVPKVGPDGQPVMQDGQPVFEERERVVSPAVTERNPLFDVVQRLKQRGTPLTPEIVKTLLGENERVIEAALKAARERGLNYRAAESTARTGTRGVLDVAKEEQRQGNRLETEEARQQNRLQSITARSEQILRQIEAKAANAQSDQEREQIFQAEQKRLDREMREKLQAAKGDDGEKEIAAHMKAIRTLIGRDMSERVNNGVAISADDPGTAYWRRLSSYGEDLVTRYAATQQDEYALFTALIRKFLVDDLVGPKSLDTSKGMTEVRDYLEWLQNQKDSADPKTKSLARIVQGDAFKRFQKFLTEVDAYADGR